MSCELNALSFRDRDRHVTGVAATTRYKMETFMQETSEHKDWGDNRGSS